MEQIKWVLFDAYYQARKTKRNTINQLRFEMHYESELLTMYEEIKNQTYKVGKSIAFIVNDPVKREIFAANFRDRVLHHFLHWYIEPIIDAQLINDAYSCRIGKGTSHGIARAYQMMKEITENFTKEAYVLKLDIQGYFMSINKNVLYHQIQKMIPKERFAKQYSTSECLDYNRLMYLIKEVIYSNPTEHCTIKSDQKEWIGLPNSKSLFKAKPNCGLSIRNLTSQLFSNVYLYDFDHYVSKKLGISAYGRYVDDFFMISPDKNKLLEAKKHCDKYLRGIGLKLHPKKIYLQSCYKGFAFLGT